MNIVEIILKDNYTLYIKAKDGNAGLFDVKLAAAEKRRS